MFGAYYIRRREGGKEAMELHKPAHLPRYNSDVIAHQLVKMQN